MTIRFDREAEEQFLVKSAIIEMAQATTEFAKKHYSDRHYAGRDLELRLRWTPTEDFAPAPTLRMARSIKSG